MDLETRKTYVLAVRHATTLDERIEHCQKYLQDYDSQDPEFIFLLADGYAQKGFTPDKKVEISWLEKAVAMFERLPLSSQHSLSKISLSQKASDYCSIVHGVLGDHTPVVPPVVIPTAAVPTVDPIAVDTPVVDHALDPPQNSPPKNPTAVTSIDDAIGDTIDDTKEDVPQEEIATLRKRQHYLRSASLAGLRWVSYLYAKYAPQKTSEDEKKRWGWAHAILNSPLLEMSDFNELYSVPCAKKAYLELKEKETMTFNDLPDDKFLYKANMILASYFLRDEKLALAEIALEKASAQLQELLPHEVDYKRYFHEDIAKLIDEQSQKGEGVGQFLLDLLERKTLAEFRESHFPFPREDRISKEQWQQYKKELQGRLPHEVDYKRCFLEDIAEVIGEQSQKGEVVGQFLLDWLERKTLTEFWNDYEGGLTVCSFGGKAKKFFMRLYSSESGPDFILVSKDDITKPDDSNGFYPYFYQIGLVQKRMLIFKTTYGQRNLSFDDFIRNEAIFKKDQSTVQDSLRALYRKLARTSSGKAQFYYPKILSLDKGDVEANIFLAQEAFGKSDFVAASRHYGTVYHPNQRQNETMSSNNAGTLPSGTSLSGALPSEALFSQGNFAAYLFSRYMANSSMRITRNIYWERARTLASDAGICRLILKMDQARDEKISLKWRWQRRNHFGFDPLDLRPQKDFPYALVWRELRKLAENKHMTPSSFIKDLSETISLPGKKSEERKK